MKVKITSAKYDLQFLSSRDNKTCKLIGISVKELYDEADRYLPQANRKNNLFDVQIPEQVPYINDKGKEDFMTLTSIDYAVFMDQKSLRKVEIPETVVDIGDSCFAGCTNLTEVMMPEVVNKIGEYLFSGCYNLTTINIPPTLKVLPKSTFENCKSLNNVELPDGLEYIEQSAFYGSGITSIKIPSSIKDINIWAFKNCGLLSTVELPKNMEEKKNIFRNVKLKEVIVYEDKKVSEKETSLNNVDKQVEEVEDFIYCPECDAKINPNVKFCPECGCNIIEKTRSLSQISNDEKPEHQKENEQVPDKTEQVADKTEQVQEDVKKEKLKETDDKKPKSFLERIFRNSRK